MGTGKSTNNRAILEEAPRPRAVLMTTYCQTQASDAAGKNQNLRATAISKPDAGAMSGSALSSPWPTGSSTRVSSARIVPFVAGGPANLSTGRMLDFVSVTSPNGPDGYLTYSGSLTQPPCTEGVTCSAESAF
ncbi:hypothetical protein KFL_006930070 [Klebsormidium nitens]|uniref:Alpha-carbonic anhydrase domain-containing protein n=1 Tax=Klebsormidium nitens TaxID=105231 RepID=A0A1Y1IN24_KLENI|nr:hypothetical protein KFL_006930070 [Klebsormidium nitens]|eukprot:GAQ90859.1 hypothetical protein KFL_006930070 [Klebsormidium nitens]